MTLLRLCGGLVAGLLLSVGARAQLQQIRSEELPSSDAVRNAYADLLPIQDYARTFEAKWPFPLPKDEVTRRFKQDLQALESAQAAQPDNAELRLLTGLVAHLTYNLDVDSAYVPADQLLHAAEKSAPGDPRPTWFLGMHQCESNDPVGGMQRLLGVESAHALLPGAFWRDYMICAQVASMPAHALRAYNLARANHATTPLDDRLGQVFLHVYTPADSGASYTARQAWFVSPSGKTTVRVLSTLCGHAFTVPSDAGLQLPAVQHGTCTEIISPPGYSKTGEWSSPTILMLTRAAKPDETLEAFTRTLMQSHSDAARPVTGYPCPVAHCLAFEIVSKDMYASAGGGHLLVVSFAGEQPEYPGLLLESPQPLPKAPGNQPQFYRAEEKLQRFPGTLYTFITLDASEKIFPRSREDLIAFLQTVQVDTPKMPAAQ